MKLKNLLFAAVMACSSTHYSVGRADGRWTDMNNVIAVLFAYEGIHLFCNSDNIFSHITPTKLVLWAALCNPLLLSSSSKAQEANMQRARTRLGFNQQRDFKDFSDHLKKMKPKDVSNFCKKLKESKKPEAKSLVAEIGC